MQNVKRALIFTLAVILTIPIASAGFPERPEAPVCRWSSVASSVWAIDGHVHPIDTVILLSHTGGIVVAWHRLMAAATEHTVILIPFHLVASDGAVIEGGILLCPLSSVNIRAGARHAH
jgi:hypothetical protein